MNWNRLILIACAGSAVGLAAYAGMAAEAPKPASSEIRHESNGYWLYVDGVRTPALPGMVYQNTTGTTHIRAYETNMHSLYSALDDESNGGQGQGRRLAALGVRAIRTYELPVENREDANRIKEIFRRLYSKYQIKVLIGDWAGLNTGMDYSSTQNIAHVQTRLQTLVGLYGQEPWVLGWQLGNENNYYYHNGRLGNDINLSATGYYHYMDDLAGVMKEAIGRRQLKQFVSLGQGDLSTNEARLIATMKNIDAVGINCYRSDPNAFEEIIAMAGSQLRVPVYFAEVGSPAANATEEQQQSEYLRHVYTVILSHGAGNARSGGVLGAFAHEATDEAWKRFEHGNENDAHYGILGKSGEKGFGEYLVQYRDYCKWVLATNDGPDTLINSAWQCLEGPYARQYSRDYGRAIAYASRAIKLYQDAAKDQQAQLVTMKAPLDGGASPNFWALNTVGTGYFLIGDAWMLLSYDYKGNDPPIGAWERFLDLSDQRQAQFITPELGGEIVPTNSGNCTYYARQVFSSVHQIYPYAHLVDSRGKYRRVDRVIEARFPELSPPYIPLTWVNAGAFTLLCLGFIIGGARVSRLRAAKAAIESEPVMSPTARVAFVLALVFNLACLFWFVSWWFHPVRAKYYTVQPVLFWTLSTIGAIGVLFYFFIWFILWNMRRPVFKPAAAGHSVALVTTRVASEAIDSLEETLKKMSGVKYPHDSFLLDEENNPQAKAYCDKWNVTHFSRRDIAKYNERTGKFQARTKGGNLNSWIYEFGEKYEFVTFLDPDHGPRPEFLDKVLGYFCYPNVAFVQGPQVFHNTSVNWITRGAGEQSYYFYGPIQMGLFGIGACVVNGSHSTFRVGDLLALNGYAVHDADDILISMRLHAEKKTGVYIPEVLAEGLAPDTWEEFSKQQKRWAYSMFHLLFHFYIPELPGMPWRCKLVYLLLTSFYFMGVAFVGLLLLPFVSAVTGNPPVNANITAFCLRYLPFLMMHYAILLLLGQRYLIPGGSRRGFWFHGGMLWVAMWWHHLCALAKAICEPGVRDRTVAAKWKSKPASSWGGMRANVVLMLAAAAAFLWIILRTDRRETVWGTLVFLGIITLSQAFIVLRIMTTSNGAAKARKPAHEARRVSLPATYSQPTQNL